MGNCFKQSASTTFKSREIANNKSGEIRDNSQINNMDNKSQNIEEVSVHMWNLRQGSLASNKSEEMMSSGDSVSSSRSSKNMAPTNKQGSTDETIIDSANLQDVVRESLTPDKEFSLLVYEEWPNEMKPALSQHFKEQEVNKLLCGFLIITYEKAETKISEIIGNYVQSTTNPFGDKDMKKFYKDWQGRLEDLSPENKAKIKDMINAAVREKRLGALNDVEELIAGLKERKYIRDDDKLKKVPNVKEFLYRCAALVIRMILQEPPLKLETTAQGKRWAKENEAFATVLPGSNIEANGAYIKYYSKPVLYRGKDVVAKGTVFIDGWD